MKYIEVTVTERDIRLGVRRSSLACPLARALHRAGFRSAQVADSVWWPKGWHPGSTLCEKLPVGAVRWTVAFDRGPSRYDEPIRPATFRLWLPKEMRS